MTSQNTANENNLITPFNLNPKCLKLYEEATKYLELKKQIGKSWLKESKKVNIIDKSWIVQWKAYVSYDWVKNKDNQRSSKKYEPMKEKHPGEISNTKIIYPLSDFLNDDDIKNFDNLVIRHDIDQQKAVKFVRGDMWKFFKDIYSGGPDIEAPILEESIRNSDYIRRYVELYLNKFNICFLPKRSGLSETQIDKIVFKSIYLSKRKHISNLKERLITIQKLNSKSNFVLRLWKFSCTNTNTLEDIKKLLKLNITSGKYIESDFISYLEYIDSRLDYINCGVTDLILVEQLPESDKERYFEIKNKNFKEGTCLGCKDSIKKMLIECCSCKEVWYCSEQCKDTCYPDHQTICKNNGLDEDELKRVEKSKIGLVGLQNLGNTCFMNTSLQCISNCWELTNYFLKNHYRSDINLENPIGTKGILARAYANFLKNIWYGEKAIYAPWNFKRAISTFQPMFSGYQQHDTQEFLNYLLDGLHEDLNRVNVKPTVEKDDNKKADNIKSLEQWYGFLQRNQSTLVDLLYGQYKSTLYCPNEKCQNISTTFDPFLSISLPLTNKVEPFEVLCFFIFYDITISPIQIHLPFSSECTIMAFRNKIAKILDVHPFSFFIVKMDGNGNYDYIVSSTHLLKVNNSYNNPNQKPFFMFQVNPTLFHSQENKHMAGEDEAFRCKDFRSTFATLESRIEETKKLFKEDYEEDESNATKESTESYYSNVNIYNSGSKPGKEPILGVMKINTDDNHGFGCEYIPLIVHLTYYNFDKSIIDPSTRDRIIFPRILYVRTDWTLHQLHSTIFEYFLSIIKAKTSSEKNNSTEYHWKKIFNNLDTSSANDTLEFQKKNNFPYRIRVRNIMMEVSRPCVLCADIDCRGCLIPCSNDIRIKDIIAKYPRNDIGSRVDNTYLYLADFQKKYHKNWNRDFSIELSWLPEFKAEVHKLNDKSDLDFKLQKSDISSGISIYDCFKKFVKLERLEDMNEWYCSNCKTHQRATKKMEIYKSPHILIIQLKRFKNLNKLDCLVDFPLVELDMSPYVMSNEENLPLIYDLFAVSNHIGSTGFGHYYAYSKNPFTGLWYRLDDSNVTPTSLKEIVSSGAYVLFYRRKNLENIIDLEETYKKRFRNYETLMQNVEVNLNLLMQDFNSNDIYDNNI